jgi:hypothetical protein
MLFIGEYLPIVYECDSCDVIGSLASNHIQLAVHAWRAHIREYARVSVHMFGKNAMTKGSSAKEAVVVGRGWRSERDQEQVPSPAASLSAASAGAGVGAAAALGRDGVVQRQARRQGPTESALLQRSGLEYVLCIGMLLE